MASRAGLIWDPKDQEAFVAIIDRQLDAIGAETTTARRKRLHTAFMRDWPEEYYRTGKSYKMTDEDIKRFQHW